MFACRDRRLSQSRDKYYHMQALHVDQYVSAWSTGCMTQKLMLRVQEAAEALGVSRAKAYELIAAGQIPSVKLGGCIRVPVAALERWIGAQTGTLPGRTELP